MNCNGERDREGDTDSGTGENLWEESLSPRAESLSPRAVRTRQATLPSDDLPCYPITEERQMLGTKKGLELINLQGYFQTEMLSSEFLKELVWGRLKILGRNRHIKTSDKHFSIYGLLKSLKCL